MTLKSAIIHADSLGYLPEMEANSVDIVITSPRYNFNKNYPGVSDKTSMGDYLMEMQTLAQGLQHVLRDDGLIFLNVGTNAANPLHDTEVASCFISTGLVLQERIIWVKADDDGGHFTPINSKCYLNNLWETIFIFSTSGRVDLDRLAIGIPYKDESNIKRWKSGKAVHCRGDVWRINYQTIQNRDKERDGHEATFPRELVQRCLLLAARERTNLVILDPCCGTGTVPCVAIEQGHIGLGIDLSFPMADAAARNLSLVIENCTSHHEDI